MTDTRPPIEYNDILHHWLVSERSSHPSIGEWIKEEWYSAGETNPISPEEMARRGWEYGGPVVVPKEFSDHWDDDGGDDGMGDCIEPRDEDEMRMRGCGAVHKGLCPHERRSPINTTDLIKEALGAQEKALDAKDQADASLRAARVALYAANDRVSKLCKQLLEEQLGSVHDAQLVLYQMSGRS